MMMMMLASRLLVPATLVLFFGSCSAFVLQTTNKLAIRQPQKIRRSTPRLILPDPSVLDVATAAATNPLISTAFNVATFGPQLPWLLMAFLPKNVVTKSVMGGWASILFFSLVHLFIVIISISEPNGSAPLADFTGVFDPSGQPLLAMQHMMTYPNFVSEEWAHVLTWDLFVGRWIWLDGLERGIFTAHSVLLTNFIGPPGLLLHFLTCLILRKGLPPAALPSFDADDNDTMAAAGALWGSASTESNPPTVVACKEVERLFPNMFTVEGAASIVKMCSENVVWEYVNEKEAKNGKAAVEAMLLRRAKRFPASASLKIDAITDGQASTGFMWYLSKEGVEGKGLRGTTYVEFNEDGKIAYVREVSENLFKPGSAVAGLLKKVAEEAIKKDPSLAIKKDVTNKVRTPSSASDLVTYLWTEINGQDVDLVIEVFDESIVYQDFTYPEAVRGKPAVAQFIRDFNFAGISFIAERISEGSTSCCFTWRVEIAGASQATKGISFYQTTPDGKRVTFVRDIAEPLIKPAPLQALASIFRPGLRRFKPVRTQEKF